MSSPVERGPRLRDSFRAMPRTAWVLFAGTFVLRLGSFVFPFLALYLTENGLSVTEAGLAIAGYGIGGVLAQLSGGLLTDRIGRRNAIALSMITSSVLVLLLLQARSLPAVLAIVIVYSFFAELHRPASGALIADLVPPEHRVAAYAFNRLLFNLSFAIGLALGGLVAEESFVLLFVLDAATSATFGVISLLALPHGTRTRKAEERDMGGAFTAILADRGFMLVLAAIFAGALVYSQAYSTFPIWVRDLGLGEKVYGFLQGLNGILVVVFELAVTAVAMRYSADEDDRPGGLAHGTRIRRVRHLPVEPRDGSRGHGVELRGDVRVSERGRLRRGSGADAPSGPVPELAGHHVRLCVHGRPARGHRDLRMAAERGLDRLRCIRCDRSGSRARRHAIPSPPASRTPNGLTLSLT